MLDVVFLWCDVASDKNRRPMRSVHVFNHFIDILSRPFLVAVRALPNVVAEDLASTDHGIQIWHGVADALWLRVTYTVSSDAFIALLVL